MLYFIRPKNHKSNVLGTTIYTDGWAAYNHLEELGEISI